MVNIPWEEEGARHGDTDLRNRKRLGLGPSVWTAKKTWYVLLGVRGTSGFSRETEHRTARRPKSMKSVGQAGRLGTQVRAEGAMLSPRSIGQASRLGTQVGFLHYSIEAEFLLL